MFEKGLRCVISDLVRLKVGRCDRTCGVTVTLRIRNRDVFDRSINYRRVPSLLSSGRLVITEKGCCVSVGGASLTVLYCLLSMAVSTKSVFALLSALKLLTPTIRQLDSCSNRQYVVIRVMGYGDGVMASSLLSGCSRLYGGPCVGYGFGGCGSSERDYVYSRGGVGRVLTGLDGLGVLARASRKCGCSISR